MDNNRSLSSDELIVKPDATSAELDELMTTGNDEIKKEIASHPNISPRILVRLFRDFSYTSSFRDYLNRVLNNSAFSLILLENPNFLDRLNNEPFFVMDSLVKFPQFFIDWAVNHSQASVRSKIARNHYLSIDLLGKLAQDMDRNVQISAAGTICISDQDFEWLNGVTTKDRTVNHHPDITLRIICQLAQDKDMNVRYVVANNTGTPIHILEQLSFDSHWCVLSAVARNRKTTEKVLRSLFQSKHDSVTESVARNRNIPNDLMEICAASNNRRFRYFIAGNSNATKAILTKLAFDQDREVRQKVANNSNAPSKIIEYLANEGIQKNEDIPF